MRKNIILAGVGGQGVVLASKLIASCAMQKGERAHTAETIGMAQRGGSVFSHVRIGEGAYSPLIPYGAADLIIGFEPSEALRALPYLRAGGTVVVSSRAIAPTTATLSGAVFDTKQRIAALRIKAARVLVVDGEALCQACGSMKALNTILLGAAAASEALGLSEAELDQTIAQTMPKTYQQLNRRALKLGAAAGREAQCR